MRLIPVPIEAFEMLGIEEDSLIKISLTDDAIIITSAVENYEMVECEDKDCEDCPYCCPNCGECLADQILDDESEDEFDD